jgi:hypothetical protein
VVSLLARRQPLEALRGINHQVPIKPLSDEGARGELRTESNGDRQATFGVERVGKLTEEHAF